MLHRPQKNSWNFFTECVVHLCDIASPLLAHPLLSSSIIASTGSNPPQKLGLHQQPWIEASSFFLLSGPLCGLMPFVGMDGDEGSIVKESPFTNYVRRKGGILNAPQFQ